MRVAAALVLCALGVSRAVAQPGAEPVGEPDAQPVVEEAPAAPLPLPAPDPRTDAAWQLYHDAFAALLQGDKQRSSDLLAQLQRDHAGHPASQLALSRGFGGPSVVDTGAGPRGIPVEQPSSNARAELALFQTIHGSLLGVEVCLIAECDEAAAYIGLALLGGVAGAGASLAQKDMTSGQRALINSGTVWGAANAGLILVASDADSVQGVTLTMIAGQLGGLAIGAGLNYLRPTSGQVGLANSGGQWGLALTALTLTAARPDLTDKGFALTLLLAMDGGIAVGSYLASRYPHVSRGQTWVIDAAGIAGGVGGAGLGILVSGSADERVTPALAAAGAVVGLGVATYLTRNWGDTGSPSNVRTVLLPAERGRGGTAGIAFTW